MSSELHAYAFEIGNERVAGEMFGAVEAHVFEEVSETALVVVLIHRAYLLSEKIVGRAGGIVVVANVICKTIVEDSDAGIGVDVGGGCAQKGASRECYGQYLFHVREYIVCQNFKTRKQPRRQP